VFQIVLNISNPNIHTSLPSNWWSSRLLPVNNLISNLIDVLIDVCVYICVCIIIIIIISIESREINSLQVISIRVLRTGYNLTHIEIGSIELSTMYRCNSDLCKYSTTSLCTVAPSSMYRFDMAEICCRKEPSLCFSLCRWSSADLGDGSADVTLSYGSESRGLLAAVT